ncbi:transposase, partial [Ostertagia ostertagi]
MPRRREVAQGVRQAIVNMKESGMKVTAISRVRNSVCNATRTGRPRCTSSKQDRRIVRRSKADPRLTAVDIATEFNMNEGTNLSRQTVGRRLKDAGIHGRRPAKKPFISSKNRRARVEFARRHLDWTVADWSRVLFTDESKFNLFGSDGA